MSEAAEACWVDGDKRLADVTNDVLAPLAGRPTALWWGALAASSSVAALGLAAMAYTVATGIGTWGLNHTIGWAFDITNFVFWIGIGHAGTLISAILFLFRQRWRNSVNRAAEAMTLIAVTCAGIFPLLHMGRPWFAYWVLPYPNLRGSLWVDFASPLLWDVFAISTYGTISAVFWYLGLLPDLATMRDRAESPAARRVLGLMSLGWSGSARVWTHYEAVYLLLAGLATPLVVSVHTVVSFDFATAVLTGWHSTIFPPYFVAGAIFSGMAMVLTLMIVARKTMRLEDYITDRHLDVMCRVILAVGCLMGLAYGTELFTAWYAGDAFETFVFANRMRGPMAWAYWTMIACNVAVPQLFWSERVRRNLGLVFAASLAINVGMWFERFVIIVSSLSRDFLPSSWAAYRPTSVEAAILAGSFGIFFTLFLLFCRALPAVAMAEVKAILPEPRREGAA